jgi:HEAT repeat protein
VPDALLGELSSLRQRGRGEQLDVLERCLRHPMASVRAAAAVVGAQLLDDAALESLLRDGADPVRRNGGREMLRRRGAQGRALATRLLADPDPDVVLQALGVLETTAQGPAPAGAVELLTHPNLNVVQAAIGVLGRSGDPRVVRHLLPFLDSDSWLKVAVIDALGAIGHPVAVTALADALSDPSLEQVAARALGRIGGSRACAALAARAAEADGCDPCVLEALAGALERRAVHLRVTPALARSLARLVAEGGRAAAHCALHLALPDLDAAALDLLEGAARIGDDAPACLRERQDLVPALLERGGALLEWGLRIVARRPRPQWVPAVATALANGAWRVTPRAIADAVLALDAPALAPAILRCYAHLTPAARTGWGPVLQRYRAPIAEALPCCEGLPEDVRAVLRTMADDPVQAAAAIVAVPLPARLDAIALALTRPDVLARLPWLEWLASEPALYARQAAAAAEAAELHRHLPAIRGLLATGSAPFLVPLVAALRDRASVPLLSHLLREGTPAFALPVLEALGRIGGDEARALLREVIERRAVGERFAYRALAACAEEADLSLLRSGLQHEDWHVRMVCLDGVGSKGGWDDTPRLAALCADPAPAVAARAREWMAA